MAGRTARPEFDDAAAQKGRIGERSDAPHAAARSAARCIVRRRDGAPKGAACWQQHALLTTDAPPRRAIPSYYEGERKETTAYPGPQRTRAAERWISLFNNRIGNCAMACIHPIAP
jgi:hypothetical protein